jgi:hypothetical protein
MSLCMFKSGAYKGQWVTSEPMRAAYSRADSEPPVRLCSSCSRSVTQLLMSMQRSCVVLQ